MRKVLMYIPKVILSIFGIIMVITGGIGMAIFIGGDRLLSWVKTLK